MKIHYELWQPVNYLSVKSPAMTGDLVNRIKNDQLTLFNDPGYIIVYNSVEGGPVFDSSTVHCGGAGRLWIQYFETQAEFEYSANRKSGAGRVLGFYRREV